MTSRPLVVQTEDLDAKCAAWLGERCELVRCPVTNEDEFAGLLRDAQGLVVRTYTRVDRALLARAPRLRVVGRAGVGLDRIDVEACRQRGVEVVHTPDANSSAVVELVFALMLDAIRPRAWIERAVTDEHWNELRRELTGIRQLEGSTLGVWGLGKIGKRVARVGVAMQMRVIYHDLVEVAPGERQGATPVALDQLLRESDFLTIHVDGRAGNKKILDARACALLKADAVVVNASRGFVADAAAIAAYLSANPSAQALLDVHDPEPFDHTYPLIDLANAHLLPHIGAATDPAHERMSWVVKDVWRVLAGEKPEHPAP